MFVALRDVLNRLMSEIAARAIGNDGRSMVLRFGTKLLNITDFPSKNVSGNGWTKQIRVGYGSVLQTLLDMDK